MRIGEKLSPDDRRRYIQACIVPGRLLHLFCAFTNPPKHKFVVVAAVDPELILFVINSKIDEWLKARPDLRDRQVTIQQRDHSFLERDSYLNCTEAIRVMEAVVIEAQLMQDLDGVKDLITDREREAICYAVEGCRTLSKKEIAWIKGALS